MSQPPDYTPQTNFAQDEAGSVAGRSTIRTANLDVELQNIETTLDALLHNLAYIQRDDLELRDWIVKPHTLHPDVIALIGSGGFTVHEDVEWAPGTSYPAHVMVMHEGSTYVSVVAHTSGPDFLADYEAGKWLLLNGSGPVTGGGGDPGEAGTGVCPVGAIISFAGSVAPASWALCDGASYATAALPDLFAAIGYAYGGSGANFNVPDLRGRVVAGVDGGAGRLGGASLGAGLGAESVTLTTANIPSHNHGISDVAHSHGVSDPSHSHGVSDPGHTHGINDPGHSHGSPETGIALNASAGTGVANFIGGADRGFVTVGGTATTNISIQNNGSNIGIYGNGTGISLYASGTGLSTTQPAGSGGAHSNVQPSLILNYIIRSA